MNIKHVILWPFAFCLILSATQSPAYDTLAEPKMPPPVSKQKEKLLKPLFKKSSIIGGQIIALKGSPNKRYSGNYVDIGTLGGVVKGDIFAVYSPQGVPVGLLRVVEPQRFTSSFEFLELQVDASENLVVKKVPDEIGSQLPGAAQINPKYAALRKKPAAPKLPVPGTAAPSALPALPGEGQEPAAMPALPSGESLPSLPGTEPSKAMPEGDLPPLGAASMKEPGALPPLEGGAVPATAAVEPVGLPAIEGVATEPTGLPPLEGGEMPTTSPAGELPPLEGAAPAGELPPLGGTLDEQQNLQPIGRPEDIGASLPDLGGEPALPPLDDGTVAPGAGVGTPPGTDLALPGMDAELPPLEAGAPVPEPKMGEMDLSPTTDLAPPGGPDSGLDMMALPPPEGELPPPGMDMGVPADLMPPGASPASGTELPPMDLGVPPGADMMAPPPDLGVPPGADLAPPGGELPPMGAAPDMGVPLGMELPPPGAEMDLAGMPPAPGAEPSMDMGVPPGMELPPPGADMDLAGMPPGAELALPGGEPLLDMGLPPGMDLAPPGGELSMPGMAGSVNPKLRMDLPNLPSGIPLMKDPVQDLPTLNSSVKRPAV